MLIFVLNMQKITMFLPEAQYLKFLSDTVLYMDLKTYLLHRKGLEPGGVTPNDDLQNFNVAYHIGLIKIDKIA